MKPAEYPADTIATVESEATLPSCENGAAGDDHGLDDCGTRSPTRRAGTCDPGSQETSKMSFLSLGP